MILCYDSSHMTGPDREFVGGIKKIMKKLEHGKQVLKKGPLPGSISYVRGNGDVIAIDWEPNRNNIRKLKDSRQES